VNRIQRRSSMEDSIATMENKGRNLCFARRREQADGWLAVVIAGALLSGCGLTELRHEPQVPPTVTTSSDESLAPYLDTMNGLGSPDPAKQADVFYEVEREYTRAPTTASSLRYAVALVTPDHPASKPVEGKKLLETLMATPERMTPAERTLAAVLIHATDSRLKLEAENRRLAATLDDRGKSQANSDKRVQAQLEENTRLRRALAEAQQKLDAIKEIERSIIERSPTPPGNRDAPNSETQSSSTSR
jgi:hypothetical protein